MVSLTSADLAQAGTDHIRMLNPHEDADSNRLAFVVSTGAASTPVGISVAPNSASLAGGKSQQFSASVSGTSNTSVTWKASGGSISASGMYTAPNSAGSFVVTATSVADTTKSASASVSVTTAPAPIVAVSISPGSASLSAGGSQQFAASVTGSSNTAVSWSATGGAISASGLYTAPSTAGTFTVTATSAASSTASASATVTVSAAPVVALTITPISASLLSGGTQQFAASVTGSSNTAVTWSATGGSISSAGLYTAASTAGTYTVKATSVADSTKSAVATVTVTAPAVVTVTVSPGSASLSTSGTQQFAATVSGSSNTAVTWSASAGTISASGLYTAPSTAGTYTVTATSAASTSASASATVSVSAPVQHSASLSWSSESGVSGYNVYRGTVSGGPYSILNTALVAPADYTDLTVDAGQTYFYVVTSVNSSGVESSFSGQVTATIP